MEWVTICYILIFTQNQVSFTVHVFNSDLYYHKSSPVIFFRFTEIVHVVETNKNQHSEADLRSSVSVVPITSKQ